MNPFLGVFVIGINREDSSIVHQGIVAFWFSQRISLHRLFREHEQPLNLDRGRALLN